MAQHVASLQSAGLDIAGLTPTNPGGGGGGGRGEGENDDYNMVLFGEYKTRKVDGRIVKSKDVRAKIAAGDLPALPPFKVSRREEPKSMCLAWHTKGVCGANCPHKFDHISYTTAEYAPLKQWCKDNYPRST